MVKHDKISPCIKMGRDSNRSNQGKVKNLTSEEESKNEDVRSSKRLKRKPANQNKDFLWMMK
jgi:hypothetical protein